MSDGEEARVLEKALSSYYHYEEYALNEIWKPRMCKWMSLSNLQKSKIPWYGKYLGELKRCIMKNAEFYRLVVQRSVAYWGCNPNPDQWSQPTSYDMDKTVLMFTQILREWSQECQDERDLLLTRLRAFLNQEIPNKFERRVVKVLIPGAGLGRLIVDLVNDGFCVEGNETSYHMLLLSRFILNGEHPKEGLTIYPFVHTFSHQLSHEHQLRPIRIPDVRISEMLNGVCSMSMSAGSFVDLYGPPLGIKWSEYYSADIEMIRYREQNASSVRIVVTNFFIDTGSNILDYLETISHVLEDGGYWVNFGPLMYHYENDSQVEVTGDIDPTTGEVKNVNRFVPVKGLELSLNDLIQVACDQYAFDIIAKEIGIKSGYGRDPTGIALLGYMCNYWLFKKRKKSFSIC
ncbi:LAFE_0E13036g1_1 [Lachancea fermentati]|uniref:carnosine N-methyltransferase n=1 Tax=Lachancea fermentati TaxID=4955 RepID=A0A1G4ME83_LACFM|nr:LAFE_0E13036g1_1 [Lachancea fermentati]